MSATDWEDAALALQERLVVVTIERDTALAQCDTLRSALRQVCGGPTQHVQIIDQGDSHRGTVPGECPTCDALRERIP